MSSKFAAALKKKTGNFSTELVLRDFMTNPILGRKFRMSTFHFFYFWLEKIFWWDFTSACIFLVQNWSKSIFSWSWSRILMENWWEIDKLSKNSNSPNVVDELCTRFHQKILKTRCCRAKRNLLMWSSKFFKFWKNFPNFKILNILQLFLKKKKNS